MVKYLTIKYYLNSYYIFNIRNINYNYFKLLYNIYFFNEYAEILGSQANFRN
jgi:hypothetical protein